ncbi:hypothetical protein GCM10011611_29100 [Aliidongia dinghuensis]|uniref:DUF2531 family protein n=1 Tax=Aliidongia dinghuensis TaxID=1867774 RepID=A0A8J3E2H4_9PROT|nr:hypothetical protein [Aliidongia dinghuensis]GGF21191.1 hypothetical protein GCM10011611_29100 [Aliidongia dinghuensis]
MRSGGWGLVIALAGLGLAKSEPAVAAADACSPLENGPPFCLLGTELAPDLRWAFVQEPGVVGLARLSTGDVLDGWTVAEVGRGWVRLGHDERMVRLSLGAGLAEITTGALGPHAVPKLRQHRWEERGDQE